MLSRKKPIFENYLDPVMKVLSGLNPNYLTLIGSIPPLLFFVFVIFHQYIWALVVFLGNAFDVIDGMVARKNHKVTAFGGFFDSVVDRIGDFFMIAAFGYGGIVSWELVVVVLLLSFLISYIRSRAELASEKREKFSIGLIERPERLITLFFCLLLYVLWPNLLFAGRNLTVWLFMLLILLSFYTIMQRLLHAYKKL